MIKQAANKKQLTILRRYEIKRGAMAGNIVTVVRSVKMVKKQQVTNEYQVIRYADGRVSCNCEARGHCCHMNIVECAEMRRCDYVAPTPLKSIPATEVAKIAIIAAEWKQQKADAAAQRQAEQDAAKISPNYQTSIEAGLSPFLKSAMAGRSRNGYLSKEVA